LEREKKQQQQQQLQLSGARKKRSWRCRLAAQWEREERRAMVGGCVSGGGDGAAEGTLARWRRAAAKRIGLSCASFFSYAASPSPPPPSKTVCASLSLSLSHTHNLESVAWGESVIAAVDIWYVALVRKKKKDIE
jgi:hypothetical protein